MLPAQSQQNVELRQSIQGSSLTDAALGGRTLPELVTVHPAGRPGYVVTVAALLVESVVGVHPPAFGWTTDDDDSA